MAQHYRQGDLLIVKIPRIYGKFRKIPNGIILQGEHTHRIINGSVYNYNWWNSRYSQYWRVLTANENCQVVHEEHETICLPKGYYGVIRQREYEPINPNRSFTWVVD